MTEGTRSRLYDFLGLAPIVVWQLIFFVGPMAILVVYSFFSTKNYAIDYTLTFKNYYSIFQNALYLRAFAFSAEIALFVTVACAILAFPVAYFLAKKAGRWRNILLVMIMMPFWISLVLRAFAWRLLLGEKGIVNHALLEAGLISEPLSYLLYSPAAIIIGLIYSYLPLYILPLYASIDKVRDSWIEAAQDLGASPFRAFIQVTLPLAMPGLIVGGVFCFIFGLGEYVVPTMLGGGKSVVVSHIIRMEFETRQNWPGGAAISVVLMAFIMMILAIALKYMRPDEMAR